MTIGDGDNGNTRSGALAPSNDALPPSRPAISGGTVYWLVPLILAAIVYYPILRNYFYADDFIHLFRTRNEDLLPYLIIPRGGHLLISYNAVFYLCDLLFGTSPAPYFVLALAAHLLNVALLFSVIRLFTDSPRLACFGAALWGVSPMNEAALGWFSVFGQVMVATAMLLVLRQLAQVAGGRPLPRHAPWLWSLLLLVACTSFGIGIGITLVFPIVAFLLLPPSPTRRRVLVALCLLAVLVPALYFGLSRATTVIYNPRNAPLFIETNPFVNLTMLAYLTGYGVATLLVGYVTSALEYPGSLALAVIGMFVAGSAAVLVAAPAPLKRRLLACLVLALACYGMIAAGRAAFFAVAKRPEAFIRPGRYHYAAPIPLAIAVGVILAAADKVFLLRPAAKHGLLLGWVAVAALTWARNGKPIDHHDNARRETTQVLAALRQAIAEAPPQQDVRIANKKFQSVGPIFASRQDIFPGWAGIFVIFFPDNVIDGKRVQFELTDRAALNAAGEGHRTATLIVEAPPP